MLSRSRDSAKSVASNTWAGVKKYSLPILVTIGKVITSASGVLNSARDLAEKSYRHYEGSTDPKLQAPQGVRAAVQLLPVAASIIVQSATRGTANVKFFGEAASNAKFRYEMPGEVESTSDADHEDPPGWFASWTHPEFSPKWNVALIGLRCSLNISLCFMFINTAYSSFKLFSLLAQLVSGTADTTTVSYIVEILLALLAATANAISALSLNIPASTANYTEILKKIQRGDAKLTPILAITMTLVLLNISSTVFASYYGTSYAFEWYKTQISILNLMLTNTITKALVLASTSVGAISELGRGSSIYRLISKWQTNINNYLHPQANAANVFTPDGTEKLPTYWGKLKVMLITSGAVDATFAGLQNLNTIPYVASQLTSIDPDNSALKAFSIATGISTGFITFAFTLEALNQLQTKIIEDILESERNLELESVHVDSDSDSEEIIKNEHEDEAWISENEESPLIKNPPLNYGIRFFDVTDPLTTKTANKDKPTTFVLDSSESSSSDSGSGYSQLIKKVGEKYKL